MLDMIPKTIEIELNRYEEGKISIRYRYDQEKLRNLKKNAHQDIRNITALWHYPRNGVQSCRVKQHHQ